MPFVQPPFDASRDFIAATFFRAAGKVWERGAPFDKSEVDAHVLKLLYLNRKIAFADSSEDEEAGQLAPATIEDQGGGWYAVNVPWLDAPEKVQGRDAAVLRAQQLRDAGEPDDHHGVVMLKGDGGWYTINALWMPEPEKVQGQEAAYERATELRKIGPPAGWQAPETLVGSDAFEAKYEIGGETIEIADIVRAAKDASGHDAVVWNKLDAETRDGLIRAEIERREAAAPNGGEGGGGTGGTSGTGGSEPPSIDDRVQALVDGNTQQQLLDKIAEIDKARAAADPPLEALGAKSSDTKPDLARLIVGVDGDLPPAGGGEGGGGGTA